MTESMSDNCQVTVPRICDPAEERFGVCSGVGMEQLDLGFGSKAMFDQEYGEEMSDYWELCQAGCRKRKRIKKSKEKIDNPKDDVQVILEGMEGKNVDWKSRGDFEA